MPARVHFPHQRYEPRPPTTDVAWIEAVAPPTLDGDEWQARMARVGESFRAARLARVYLVHGTFVGEDLAGLSHLLSLIAPDWSGSLRQYEKQLADWYVRDRGNYTRQFAETFERGINGRWVDLHAGDRHAGDGREGSNVGREKSRSPFIPVRLLHWTSENHHLGRADGAIRMIDSLATAELAPESRVLLWGHSHGGNVLALTANLLAADEPALQAFFKASRPFWHSLLVSEERKRVWRRVRELLADPAAPVRKLALDMVTFGTPIRYGWNPHGYARLLHVIYHRPTEGVPAYLTRFPFSVKSAAVAKRGDYVQQVGIAGTNFPPALLAFPTHMADRRLNRLLQSEISLATTWKQLCAGLRVPDAGDTLLVDYHQAAPRMHHGAHGHAIYTRTHWLLYHAELVARRWYRSDHHAQEPRRNA